MPSGAGFGIVLVIVGLIFGLAVWGILAALHRLASPVSAAALDSGTGATETDGAVLVVEPGGRVGYLSERARALFEVPADERADLAQLLRRVRPSDDFLDVIASPGKRKLSLNGRPVEVTSFRVPGPDPRMVLSVQDLDLAPTSSDPQDGTPSVLGILGEFSASVTSSLDLETVARSVLDNTLRLVPADVLELSVVDHEAGKFETYRLVESAGRLAVLKQSRESSFGDMTRSIAEARRPVLLLSGDDSIPAFQSYLGIPLLAGTELEGVLEAGQASSRRFTTSEADLLQIVAPHVAGALRNAQLYEQERRRVLEFSGLAGIAQAVASIAESEQLFSRLVDAIAPLFHAEVVGFLIYDEGRQVLEAQVPFRGLPPHIVRIYRTRIEPGSAAESLINDQRPIFTHNAAADETWGTLGLTDLAIAASLRDSVLMPLVAAGRVNGYLQLSHMGTPPTGIPESELRLLKIVSDQVASIIDNAVLVRESRERISRSQVLAQMAEAAGAAGSLDDLLSASLRVMSSLFGTDLAVAFLLDEPRGELRLHEPSALSAADIPEAARRAPIDDAAYLETAVGARSGRMWGRIARETQLHPLYRSLCTAMNMESAIAVPLLARGRPFGELVLGSRSPDFFAERDLEFTVSAAATVAAAMDRLRLASQTDASLRRRLDHLTSATRVGRELAASRSPDEILKLLLRETINTTGADCGSILVADPDTTGGDPRRLASMGCPDGADLTNLERRSLDAAEALSISDFDEHADLDVPHPGIRSALFVAIPDGGRSIGLIQVHSTRPNGFDALALEFVQGLAVQGGMVLANSRQEQEEHRQRELLQRRADTLQKFSQASSAVKPDLPLEAALTVVADGIRESTPFRVVLISLYESETGMLRRLAGAGIEPDTLAELQARKQPLSTLRQLTQPQFKIGNSYFIPADQTPVLPADIHYVYASDYSEAEVRQNAWDPDDFLLVPLDDAEGNPLGLISLDDPSNGLRPDRATIESVELFAAHAAQIIVNSRQVAELNSRIESLSSGMTRQQQLLSVTQNDLPVLLHKDLEQTMALHGLERRAQRVRAGLAITESISRQLDASSALLALGRETLTQFGMSIALVAENTPEGARLLHVLGNVPSSMNIEALFGQRNPLRSSMQTGAPILVTNVEDNEEWRETPLLGQLRAKGVISLPVLIENRPVAAMMALSTDPLPPLTEEDRQVYLQISRQASVVLQNISLLNETRHRLHEVNILLDFSRQLGGLDPGQIVLALLHSTRQALTAAHAGAVLLWNEDSGKLEPRAASGYADDDSILKISYRSGEALPGTVFASGAARRVDELDFARDYALQPADLGLYRRGTGGRLPVSSLLLPILIEGQGIGLILLDNFNTVAAFKPGDEALVLSLAQQAALSLENVRLLNALTERAGQLQGLNEVATTMASSLRSDQLIAGLLDQLGGLLPYDTATLWLRNGDHLSVVADRGFADNERRQSLSVKVAESALFQEILAGAQPLFVPDVRTDPRFPSVESPRLSWLGVPMLAKGNLTGLLALESAQASFYTREQIQLAATLASQAAVALENASLYEGSVRHAAELDERSQRLALLNRFSASLSGLLDADAILSLAAEEMQRAFSAGRVSAVSFVAHPPEWVAATPSPRQRLPLTLEDAPIFTRLRESLGVFVTEDAQAESELAPIKALVGTDTKVALAIPVTAGEELLALLFISDPASGGFLPAEMELARTLANQASVALQGARLHQSTVRSAEHLTLLNQASADIGTSLDPESIYVSIHRAVERLMPVDAFLITLLDNETQQVEAVYQTEGDRRLAVRRASLGRGLGSRVISSGSSLLLNDAAAVADLDGNALDRGKDPLRAAVSVPMVVGGRTVGMLSARSRRSDAYSEEDLRILATLANQAVVTIQNGRLFAETQRLAQELEQRVVERTSELRREQQNTETLLRILTEVSSSLDLDRALNRTLTLLNEVVQADQGTIMLLSPDDHLLHFRAGFGEQVVNRSTPAADLHLQVGEGLAGWVVEHREAALVDDIRKDTRWRPIPGVPRQQRSAVLAPLMAPDEVIGVLMLFSRKEAYFTVEALALIQGIANQVAAAINNARLYELVRDQAERLGQMLRKEQEEASRSQAILESVADGVLVTSADNRISFMNASVPLILGPDVTAAVGHPMEKLSGLFGESGQAWVSAIRRWSESPDLYAAGDTYAERLELAGNRIGLIHLAPVILEHDFLGTVSILRDITHEVEVDRLKSEFVATVSHELRTPMTAIKGYVEMLLMGAVGAVNENQAHFLDIVRNNIDRLNRLVGDLLDVSRIESGNVALAPEPLDLSDLAEEVISEFRQKSEQEKKALSISLKSPKDVPPVVGDPERLRQILRILLDNAYHYTPENGAVDVQVRSLPRRSALQIEVKDNGIGISPADQERVFERFFRGEHPLVLATPGTGLGLSIARQLAEMHHGSISMQSEGVEGRGSTFTLSLPAQARASAAPAKGKSTGRKQPIGPTVDTAARSQ